MDRPDVLEPVFLMKRDARLVGTGNQGHDEMRLGILFREIQDRFHEKRPYAVTAAVGGHIDGELHRAVIRGF